MSGARLAFEDVACVRGERLLFEAMRFALGPGEAAIVSGPNGAGKSSLLRIAAGLLRPAAGHVARSGAVALAGELAALDGDAALGEALAFWARIDGRGPDDVARGLAAMALDGLAQVPVRMLSTGQRKRATLARTIAGGAPIWLLDEPGNGLDADALAALATAMAAHRAAGGLILAATHQPLAIADAREIRVAAR